MALCSPKGSSKVTPLSDADPSSLAASFEFDRCNQILIALTRMFLEHAKIRARPQPRVEDFHAWALHGGGRLKTVLRLSAPASIAAR
jgi:hypothetical protein